MTESVDWLVEGTVITMDRDRRVIRDGAVAVSDGRIVAVDKAETLRERFAPERILGGKRRFVIPGLIDCHNHVAQALVREYALEDYPNIYRVYIPAEDVLGEEGIRTSTRVAAAQLLRAGVTTLTETTCTRAHEDPIAETIMEVGIRSAMAVGQGDRVSRLAGNYEQIDGRSEYTDDPGLRARQPRGYRGLPPALDRGGSRTSPALDPRPRRALLLRRDVPGDDGARRAIRHRGDDPHQPGPGGRSSSASHSSASDPSSTSRASGRLATRLVGDPRDAHDRPRDPPARRERRGDRPCARRLHGHRLCHHEDRDDARVRRSRRSRLRHGDQRHPEGHAHRLHHADAGDRDSRSTTRSPSPPRMRSRWERSTPPGSCGGRPRSGRWRSARPRMSRDRWGHARLFPSYNPIGTLVRYAVGTDAESVMVGGRLVVDGGSC